jgi:hypothetical protein
LIRKNFELFKKTHLPPNLRYDFIDLNRHESKVNEIKCNPEKKGNRRNRGRRRKNKNTEQLDENFKIVKPLKPNIILKAILSRRNELWKKELFEKIKQVNGYAYTDDNFLTIVKPSASDRNKNPNIESLDEWTKNINNSISAFIREFRVEQIEYGNIVVNRGQIVGDLKSKINEIRNFYLIDFIDSKEKSVIWIIGRKIHVKDFLERNLNFKCMTKNFKRDQQKKEVETMNDDWLNISNLEFILPIAAKGISTIVSNLMKK